MNKNIKPGIILSSQTPDRITFYVVLEVIEFNAIRVQQVISKVIDTENGKQYGVLGTFRPEVTLIAVALTS